MDEEIQKGADGRIIMKMNSVTDMDFIRKVQEASAAGVKVDLIVRGICCILPGVKENTENLRVTSIEEGIWNIRECLCSEQEKRRKFISDRQI